MCHQPCVSFAELFANSLTPRHVREPRLPRGPWVAFWRLISGRPGGARTRTPLLLPGAPSGHVYSEFHGVEWYNSRSSHMLSIFIRVTAGANFTGLYPVYQIPRYRMRNFTCRPLYLPPYPTNAPFGIWHLLRTAHSGLEAALPIAFDGWVSIPFSSTGR